MKRAARQSIDALLSDPASSFHIPRDDPTDSPSPRLQCCCGKTDCAFLVHGDAAFAELERDVRAAAKVGQALLVRHEAYVADAERERTAMTAAMANLERDTQALEAENVRLAAENKKLLAQVEELNGDVADSDGHAQSLSAALQSAQQELVKMSSLASRAEGLERQIGELEAEQARLQARLAGSEDDQEVTAQKWRNAQRKVLELEEQMEMIEKEAHEERQRHAEVMAQMEKRRAVEKELQSSSERLKKAANGGENGEQGKQRNEVVSKFVKEILQDNANLQLNMVELQELLANANDEVEALRQQLSESQEIEVPSDKPEGPPSSLEQELDRIEPSNLSLSLERVSQELHVHHHYHAPQQSRVTKARPQLHQHPILKKKRHSLLSSGRTTPTLSETSEQPSNRIKRGSTSSIPGVLASNPNRWSGFSTQSRSSFGLSSGPSSPQSTSYSNCPSTIFELPPRATYPSEDGADFSRPTSPSSAGAPLTPPRKPLAMERPLSPVPSQLEPLDTGAAPTLRRAPSQTSLLSASISGMDIHSTIPTPASPTPSTRRGTARPALLQNSSSSAASALTATTAEALQRRDGRRGVSGALRTTLGEKTRAGVKEKDKYTPLQDTFGNFGRWWQGKRKKGELGVGRGVEVLKEEVEEEDEEEVRVSTIDEEALKECLVETAER